MLFYYKYRGKKDPEKEKETLDGFRDRKITLQDYLKEEKCTDMPDEFYTYAIVVNPLSVFWGDDNL